MSYRALRANGRRPKGLKSSISICARQRDSSHSFRMTNSRIELISGQLLYYCYSIFTIVPIPPFFRDPQGTTCGCATCDPSLMDSPITRRSFVIPIQSEESHWMRSFDNHCLSQPTRCKLRLHYVWLIAASIVELNLRRYVLSRMTLMGVFIVVHQHALQKIRNP